MFPDRVRKGERRCAFPEFSVSSLPLPSLPGFVLELPVLTIDLKKELYLSLTNLGVFLKMDFKLKGKTKCIM